jgi:hypothetical protein
VGIIDGVVDGRIDGFMIGFDVKGKVGEMDGFIVNRVLVGKTEGYLVGEMKGR